MPARTTATACLALLVWVAWPAAGCTGRTTSDKDLVMVDVSDAREIVAGRKRFFGLAGSATGAFVDPRSAEQYRQGHLPGAISLPFQFVSQRSVELRGYDVIVVYGNDYHDDVADAMSKRLLELGFKDVRTLRGGLRLWKSSGGELRTGPDP